MKEIIIQNVLDGMRSVLTVEQLDLLSEVTQKALAEYEIVVKATDEELRDKENSDFLGAFISSKKVEGCSEKTLHYYKSSIEKMIAAVKKNVCNVTTNDIRCYLADMQEQRKLSKVTIDNLRRIFSSFFSWLEDEDYITKSPVRRIHKVRTDALVKEVLTDENIEVLRDSCQELRDMAMIDLLLSTGMRVGELVKSTVKTLTFKNVSALCLEKVIKSERCTSMHVQKYTSKSIWINAQILTRLCSSASRNLIPD